MIVRRITDRAEWDTLAEKSETFASTGSFLHSWTWGAFQEWCGRSVLRFSVQEGDADVALAQCIRMQGPMHQWYWYCPRGPRALAPSLHRTEIVDALMHTLHAGSFFHGPLFVRFDPEEEWPHPSSFAGPMVQPWATRVLDLTLSPDALLAGMKQKTRYNIRLAEKSGVTVARSRDSAALERFLSLLRETSARQQIRPHPDAYYRIMRDVHGDEKNFWIYEATVENALLASGLFVRFGKTTTYLHGASSSAEREKMAPYRLHWQAIMDAQSEGAMRYDFFGVAATKEQQERWKGITRFKDGFGGTRLEFARTREIPLRKSMYRLYRFLKMRPAS